MHCLTHIVLHIEVDAQCPGQVMSRTSTAKSTVNQVKHSCHQFTTLGIPLSS